jgi:hypothetical protein
MVVLFGIHPFVELETGWPPSHLKIQVPPGVEVDYPVIESSTTTRKKSKTHYVFTVSKE